ncbi:MAG: NAD-dependent succinate-semialdehyde dehydrogenase [Hyphomicrobiales bacterium]
MKLSDASLLKEHSYINGAWVGTPEVAVTNPATGAELAKVPNLGRLETDEAIAAADDAFKIWSKMTAKEREALMKAWFRAIMDAQEDIAQIMTAEQGKPIAEARGEVAYAASFVEYYAEEAKRVLGETIPHFAHGSRVVCVKQPLGVIGAITPWNFPAAMITRKVCPAMAVGCTAVIKPAPDTPLTALALAELAHRVGIPKGVLNIVTGDAVEIGKSLCESSTVRFIGFTGSTPVGKLLMKQSADTVKRVGLELGGNAPFIVFDDADVDSAVEGAMISKFRNTGQTCVCANRIFVQDAIYDEFVEKLAAKVAELKVGDGTKDGVTQGPLINDKAVEKIESHVKDAVSKGGKLVIGGKRHALGGTYYEPTIVRDVTREMKVSVEETFGPLAPVYRFRTEDEVVALANDTNSGLASYFYSRDIGRVWRVAEALEYGMVGINSGLISSEMVPFGGVKESGLGREGSHHGIDEFVETKYMLFAGLDS